MKNTKKLELKKITLANLETKEMAQVLGGQRTVTYCHSVCITTKNKGQAC